MHSENMNNQYWFKTPSLFTLWYLCKMTQLHSARG